MVKALLIFLFSLFFVTPAMAKISWEYKSFPFVNKNFPAKLKEPSALSSGKTVLHALMSKESGTHLYWGVEQIFASRDLKKTVLVKYNVTLSSEEPIGGWTRLPTGYVLHLKIANSIVAIFAKGLNNIELYEVQRQFARSKSNAIKVLNPFMECSYAEEVVGGEERKDQPAGQPTSTAGANYLERAGNVMKCLKDETVDALWEATKTVAQNASWEGAKNGAKNAVLAVWDSVPSWEETKAGVQAGWTATASAVTATGQYIKDNYNDPVKVGKDLLDKFEKTKEVVVMFGSELLNKVKGLAALATEVQDLFICHSLKEFAKEGGLQAAIVALTGVGAAAAAAKVAMIVAKYALKVGPVVKALQVVNAFAHLGKEKMLEMARKVLRGEMSQKDIDALREKAIADGKLEKDGSDLGVNPAGVPDLKSDNERLRNLASGQKEAMLRESAALSDDQRKVRASEVLGRELSATQQKALIDAHNIGSERGFGEYTPADLKAKRETLLRAGYTPDEVENLMRRGIAGQYSGSVAGSVTFEAPQLGGAGQGPRVAANYFKTNPELRLMKLEKPEDFAVAKQYFTEQGDEWARRGRPEVARVEYLRAGNASSYTETFMRPLPGGGYRLTDVDAARAAVVQLQKEIKSLAYPSGRVNVPVRNNADFFNTSEALYSREYYDRYVKVRQEAITNLQELIDSR